MISINFSPEIQKQIHEIVYARDVETGVTLFGKRKGHTFEVLHVCGPGPIATHEEFHYSGDNDYASFVYDNLLKADPELAHLGELHTHPYGMRRLSIGDRKTVEGVLKTYEDFVAGVMLRFRGGIEVYPMYFSRKKPQGEKMQVLYVAGRHRRNRSWFRRKGNH
jgi:proteasome lid subunit RPN8/RPN11